jgi:hypothetical protein
MSRERKMSTPIKDIVDRIDELVEKANPEDGSAPMQPVLELGNYLNEVWPTVRKRLLGLGQTPGR